MNQAVKILLLFGALLSHPALSVHIDQIDEGLDDSKVFCNQPLLQSYGLIGSPEPLNLKLSMCPNVVRSCCIFSDQITIYEQWVHRGELKNLEDRFAHHQAVYGAVIDAAVNAQDNANTVLKKLKAQRISNCKVLAKRIVHFEFKDLALRLKNAIAEMHKFFVASYSGFYCSLCDATNHKFFRNETKEVVYSMKFCRDLTEKSLNVLLYFHSHMLKFANLLLKFTTYCDSNGYFSLKPISNDDLFYVLGNDRRMLETCRDFRNSKTWFDECETICTKFHINSYDYFFEPHLKKFKTFAKILANAEVVFDKPDSGKEAAEKEDKEANSELNSSLVGRKLSDIFGYSQHDRSSVRLRSGLAAKQVRRLNQDEHPNQNPKDPQDSNHITEIEVINSENPFPSQSVILAEVDSPFALDTYDNVFEENGISLFQIGFISQVNKLEFEKVQAEMIRLGLMRKSARLFPGLLTALTALAALFLSP
jgi:hypothetical protein